MYQFYDSTTSLILRVIALLDWKLIFLPGLEGGCKNFHQVKSEHCHEETYDPEVIKNLSCSTQLSMKFELFVKIEITNFGEIFTTDINLSF